MVFINAAILLLIILLIFFVAWRWLTQLDIVFNHLISKNNSFLSSPDPWRFRLYFNYVHIEMFQNFEVEFDWHLRLLHVRNAEIYPCPDWCPERQQKLWENWAQSVFRRKRIKMNLIFLTWLILFLFEFSHRLFCGQTYQNFHAIFQINFILLCGPFRNILQKSWSLHQVSWKNLRHRDIVFNLEVIKRYVVESVFVEFKQVRIVFSLLSDSFLHLLKCPCEIFWGLLITTLIEI